MLRLNRLNRQTYSATRLGLTFGLLASPLPMLIGCELPTQVQAGNSAVEVEIEVAPPIPGNAICDPFGNAVPYSGRDRGLLASLYYVPSDARGFNHVQNYIDQGVRLNADLYFNQVNVPTRPFDKGFTTQNNTLLLTPNGDTLYEYFGLRFEGQVGLGRQNAPGLYQFALVADDGAVLQISENGLPMGTIVDDDGTHPSQMACAPRAVQMAANTRLPMRLDYYQGPRFHIALMVLWRRVADQSAASLSDPACGLSGNDRFFDSTQSPSAPMPTWIDMLGRGWTVLNSSNYYLPPYAGPNPCASSAPGGNGCTGPDCGPGSNGS